MNVAISRYIKDHDFLRTISRSVSSNKYVYNIFIVRYHLSFLSIHQQGSLSQ